MSSEAPLPPPPVKSNSGTLIGVGVVMLLLIGGLVLWKLNQASDTVEVVEQPAPTASAAPEPSVDFEPPPPPPPEEELEEKEPAGSDKPPSTVASGPAGCSGTCSGQLTMQGQSALRAKGGQARTCYDRALRVNPELSGRMTVQVKIGASGAACGVTVSGDLQDPSLTSCVTQMFRAGKYPAPTGGCVTAAVPLNFVAPSP